MEPSINTKRDIHDPEGHDFGSVDGGATGGEGPVGTSLQVWRSQEEIFGHGAFRAASVANDALLNSTLIHLIHTNMYIELGFIPRLRIRRGTAGRWRFRRRRRRGIGRGVGIFAGFAVIAGFRAGIARIRRRGGVLRSARRCCMLCLRWTGRTAIYRAIYIRGLIFNSDINGPRG